LGNFFIEKLTKHVYITFNIVFETVEVVFQQSSNYSIVSWH